LIFLLGLDDLRETVERLKNQVAESARQESMLVMRLADKEQEVQDLLVSDSLYQWQFVSVFISVFRGTLSCDFISNVISRFSMTVTVTNSILSIEHTVHVRSQVSCGISGFFTFTS
jgi:hypothetical protein